MSAETPVASPTPDGALAETADVAQKNQATKSRTGRRAEAGVAQSGSKKSDGDQPGRGAADSKDRGPGKNRDSGTDTTGPGGSGATAVQWHGLTTTTDGTGDHGNGPAYADITALTLQDSGADAMLRVTVAGVLPGRLMTGEVQGVGVDLFRSDDMESDYQVFFDGGTHGWRAFLQTPDGFVDFPGTFTVSGRSLTAVLPWASLGGREDAAVSAFADWSSGVGRLSADGVPQTEVSPG